MENGGQNDSRRREAVIGEIREEPLAEEVDSSTLRLRHFGEEYLCLPIAILVKIVRSDAELSVMIIKRVSAPIERLGEKG